MKPIFEKKSSAISPVIGVVLFVAIVVTLAGVVGFFATNLGENTSETGTAGVQTDQTDSKFTVNVIQDGNSENLSIRVNGRETNSIPTSTGDSLTLSDVTQLCEGDTVTIVSTGDNSTDSVVSSSTVESDMNCQLKNTTTSSTAEYDGSSWIVDTYIENTGTEENSYVVVLSDGNEQQVTNTVTLQPGESTTVQSTNSTYSKNDPITIGVISPNESSSEYTLAGGSASTSDSSTLSTTTGWSGGDQAGDYYYKPTTTSGTTINSSDSKSSFTSSDGSSSEPDLSLSTSRTKKGEEATLYATLTTTKSPEATETILVYANETNSSANRVAEKKVTIQEGEDTTVAIPFSINTANQYSITASLKSSDKIYTVGTLNVVSSSSISVSNVSYSPSNPNINEKITFSADVNNSGGSSDTVTVEFFENGAKIVSKEVSVGAGSTKTVTESFTPTQEGLYTFHIGLVEPAIIKEIGEEYINDSSSVTVSTTYSPRDPVAGDEVTFDATASHSDGSVTIEEYQWDFSDGKTVTTTNSTYKRTFDKKGEYIEYTVTAVASNGDSQITGSSLYVSYSSGATPTTFVDKFDDGTYSDKWTVTSGNWSEGSGYLNGSGYILRTSDSAYGTWEFTHNHGNRFFGAQTWIVAIDTDGDKSTIEEGYYINHYNGYNGSNYRRELRKKTPAGTADEVLVNLGEFDSGTHTYKVTRKTDGTFIVYADGIKVGEAKDNTYTKSEFVQFASDDSGHQWYDFSISE